MPCHSNSFCVLAIGEGARASGYARVLDSLLPYLADSFDLHHLTLANHQPVPALTYTRHGVASPFDRLGLKQLAKLLTQLKPKLLFVLHDPWYLEHVQKLCLTLAITPKIVAYLPLDSIELRHETLSALAFCTRLIAYTQHGKQVLTHLMSNSGIKLPCDIAVIAHGIDRKRFYPLCPDYQQAKLTARSLLFPNRPELMTAFIALNGNRITVRKRIDISIQGFAAFYHRVAEPCYLLLTANHHIKARDLEQMTQQLGIEKQVLWLRDSQTPLTDEYLNLVYNAADCGINSAWSEGFGLVAFEHAAAAPAAQIMPKHSACAELWHNSALLLEPVDDIIHVGVNRIGGHLCASDLSQALTLLLHDQQKRTQLGRLAHANVLQNQYDWKIIAQTFKKIWLDALQS